MYHFVAQQAPNQVHISDKFKIPGHISQYFKNFQIDAVRFLLPRFIKHEFSVFNDESGLGKTAVVSVLLGAVTLDKKCLIVVNDDDCVTSWQFHLDVLTNLSVMVIKNDKDFTDNVCNVYIGKWNTLRSIDLSKFNFHYIVVDNRGQMLNNSFCTSMLIKNYERKVDIIISSIDITSNLRLLYNSLRLGGRLENKYQSYSVFETHFKVPDLKELLSRKIRLEEYDIKREILSNYCKEFRLRRFCYEFAHELPLVKGERDKISLGLWRTATNVNETQSSSETVNNIAMSLEKLTPNGTFTKLLDNPKYATVQENNKLKLVIDNVEKNEEESPLMSPLMLLSDSEGESVHEELIVFDIKSDVIFSQDNQPEIVDLSSNEAIYVDSKMTTNIKDDKTKIKPIRVNVRDINANVNKNISSKKVQKIQRTKRQAVPEVKDSKTNLRKTRTVSAEKPLPSRERKTVERKDSKTSTTVDKRTASRITTTTSVQKMHSKKRKKNDPSDKKVTEINNMKISKEIVKPKISTISKIATEDKPISKKSPTKKTAGTARISTILRNLEWKATRRMSRLTRHASVKNKYLQNNLTLIIDPKTDPNYSRKANKLKNKNKTKLKKEETKENNRDSATKEVKGKTKVGKENTDCKQKEGKINKKPKQHKNLKNQSKSKNNCTSELPLLSTCSEYEDMQCAQRLPSASSNNQRISTEFLVPPTPPAYMMSMANLPSASLTDNDIIYVSTKDNVKIKNQDVIVLSSSQESSQSNQSRRTMALKQKKVLRPAKTKEEFRTTFVDVFDKYIERNKEQSPDLFSNCSDVPITCTQPNKNVPFDGFKIFGSEVKQLQQQTALLDKKRKLPTRSCLDLLENMFDPNLKKSVLKTVATNRNNNTATPPILPAHPNAAITNLQRKQVEKNKNTKNSKTSQNSANLVNDDVFEITTNDIFESTMRVTANGDVSPIQTKSASTNNNNHNKITNYLIGNTHLTPVDDETNINTPNRRILLAGPNKIRSPKSKTTQATQTTKLTKWFHKKNLSEVSKVVSNSTRTVSATEAKTSSTINVIATPTTRTKTLQQKSKGIKRLSETAKEPRRSKRLDITV